MKRIIVLACLAATVFSLAPYHTVAVPMAPDQAVTVNGEYLPPPPAEPSELPPPPPSPLVIILPPPPPSPILLLPPVPAPPPAEPAPAPPPPAPEPPGNGVPETSATWLLLLLGLSGTFTVMLFTQRRSKDS